MCRSQPFVRSSLIISLLLAPLLAFGGGAQKPSAYRLAPARSKVDTDRLGKILAGTKRYLPGKASLPREQLLAELLEQHPEQLEEVAGFAGISAGELRKLIQSGAWESKKPWGVSVKSTTGVSISGPWLIRRYLAQREAGMSHQEALDHLAAHYEVARPELERYFSVRGAWAKGALRLAPRDRGIVVPAGQAEWAVGLVHPGGEVSAAELMKLYAQGGKMTLEEAKLSLAGAPPRADVVRAMAKFLNVDEKAVAAYFASGAWGEVPMAVSETPLVRKDETTIAPLEVLDTYANSLPAARRTRGLQPIYDRLSTTPGTAVWDGDAVHGAAAKLGISEAALFDYLKAGKWARRRTAPSMVAASWNTASNALTFNPEQHKAAEALVVELRSESNKRRPGRGIDGVRLGTKPLVVGKRAISPDLVLKELVDADPTQAKNLLTIFAHGQPAAAANFTTAAQLLTKVAQKLDVPVDALCDYLVYGEWTSKAGGPDRKQQIARLSAALGGGATIGATNMVGATPETVNAHMLELYAKETNVPVALATVALEATHDGGARQRVAAAMNGNDTALFGHLNSGDWGLAAHALGTRPLVNGNERVAPERVLGVLADVSKQRGALDVTRTELAQAAQMERGNVAARALKIDPATYAETARVLGVPEALLEQYVGKGEWTKFDSTLSADGKRTTELPELDQLYRVYLHEGEKSAGRMGRALIASVQRGKKVNKEKVDPRYAELLKTSRFELGMAEPDAVVHVSFDSLMNRVAHLPVAQLGRTVVIPASAKRSDGSPLGDLELMEELHEAKDGLRRVFNVVQQNAERKKQSLPEIPVQLSAIYEGNRGTGKTSVAKLYARMLKQLELVKDENIVEITLADLARKTGGNAQNVEKELEAHKGKVVVVEGLEALKNDNVANMMDYQAAKVVTETLAKMAAAKDLVVVWSGDPGEVKGLLSQESVKRLAPTKLGFPDYKNQTLGRILDKLVHDQKYELDEKTTTQVAKMIGSQRGADFTNAVAVSDALKAAIARQSTRLYKAGRANDPAQMKELSIRDFVPEKPSATGPDSAFAKLDGMIGLDKVKEQFRALDNLVKYNEKLTREGKTPTVPSLNAMFVGNPGTGKTTVARLYGRFLSERGFLSNGGVVEVTAKELLGKTVGEAATLMKQAVQSAKGKVLFIDEAYAFYDKSGIGYGKDALDMLVGLINPESNQDIAIVMAGYKGEMEEMVAKSNPGLSRRMGRTFQFEDYTVEQLGKILDGKAKEKSVKLTPDAHQAALNELARLKRVPQFGNGGAVNNMIDQAIVRMADRLAQKGNKKSVSGELVAADLVPQPAQTGTAMKELEKMSGLESVKQTFRELDALVVHNREREKHGLSPEVPSLNAVFSGNPGTGKTTVARLYGKFLKEKGFLSDGEIIEVKPQDIIGNVIGATETKVKELLERAQGKVLFIDEAYQLHEKNGAGYGEKAIDALVAAINADGNQNFAVVLAGYKNEMDDLMRNSNPGLSRRFRQKFEFDDYKDDDLAKIMEKKARDKGYTIDKAALSAAVSQLGRERSLPNFGNAGAVENMINNALQRQAGRLRGRTGLSKEELTALTAGDLVAEAPNPQAATDVLHDLVGQDQVKTKIEEYQAIIADAKARGVDPAKYFEPYFRFTGNPGTGKTTVAKKMGTIFKQLGFLPSDEVVVKDAADLIANYEGQTANRVEDIFKSAMGKTLFIDEAYKLGDPHSPFAKQAVERLLTLLSENKGKVAVILAGYGRNMEVLMQVNPGLKSRFSEELKFTDLTNEGARSVFARLGGNEKMSLSADAQAGFEHEMQRLMEAPEFANYRDVETLYSRVQRKRALRVMKDPHADRSIITHADIEAAVSELIETKNTEHPGMPQHTTTTHVPEIKTQSAQRHVEAPRYEHAHAEQADVQHEHGAPEHEHEHEHDTAIGRMYDANQHQALDALQYVVDHLGLDGSTVNDMEKGNVPPAALSAMAQRMKVSEHEAKQQMQKAFSAMKQVEEQLARMAQPQPPKTKLVSEEVCIACGRPGHNFRPVRQTYAVDEAGNRTLVSTERLPGVGW